MRPEDPSAREQALIARYGQLMSLADVAQLLRYPTVQAARRAILRGVFPVPMVRMPPRRGWYATPRRVAQFLDTLDSPVISASQHHSQEEDS